MLIRGIEPTTTPDPGTDRYLPYRIWCTNGRFSFPRWSQKQSQVPSQRSRKPQNSKQAPCRVTAPILLDSPARPGPVMAMPSCSRLSMSPSGPNSCQCAVRLFRRQRQQQQERRAGEPRGRSVFDHTSSAYMVALHQWTSSAGHSLDLACGRLSAHAKLGLCMVATAWPCHSPPSFH